MTASKTPLTLYSRRNHGRLVHQWMHYFDIYDRAFSSFRDKKVTVVEIGVFHGGSLQMWKKYFGRRAHIFGIDIDERVKSLVERRVRIETSYALLGR